MTLSLPIAYVLANDTVDRTALQVYNLSPNRYPLGASSVPSYLYQSLSTLWMGATGMASGFPSKIVTDFDTGKTTPAGCIVVSSQHLTEQVYSRSSMKSDMPGAEASPVYIILYMPSTGRSNYAAIINVQMRIRYLIDNTLRQVRGLYGGLPEDAMRQDPSIDVNFGFFCQFRDNCRPVQDSAAVLCFECQATRLFTK